MEKLGNLGENRRYSPLTSYMEAVTRFNFPTMTLDQIFQLIYDKR